MRVQCVSGAILLIGVVIAVAADSVIVSTSNGPLRGENRGHYYAFEGIPYAKAPLGDLRLAPSELNIAQWDTPRDATKPGPVCMQWNHLHTGDDKLIGEEDCLYLNVYTTSLEKTGSLPTIFHIHGGAFMFGSGDFYQPDNLITRPLVIVTFNYRVGPLGFLSTEDDIIPGNFGLKDQVLALKWVRQNIINFGGHPESITLSGCSAGSASVHLHYLSPLSRNLFRNGIGSSGAVLNPWVMTESAAEKTKSIAQRIGCSVSSSETILECLRKKSASDIVKGVAPLLDYLYNPFTPTGVVVEKQTKRNSDPFLPDHPLKLMQTGEFQRVPFIMAASEVEGLYPGAEFITKPEYLEDINEKWNQLLPSILDYQVSLKDNQSKKNKLSQAIREHYLGDAKLNEDTFPDLLRIISNRLYFTGIINSAKLMQEYIPVYFYFNMYKTKYGVGEYLSNSTKNYGVSHGDDVLLVMKNPLRDEIPYTEEELLMAGRFAEMYELFAKDGVAQFGGTKIPQLTRKDMLDYLEIGYPESTVRTTRQLSDEQFWNSLDFNDGTFLSSRNDKSEL